MAYRLSEKRWMGGIWGEALFVNLASIKMSASVSAWSSALLLVVLGRCVELNR